MAQQRTHVPKFGNWESEENVPYTAYFDKARKGRTGTKMINPNDPEENPDILDSLPSDGPPPSKGRDEPGEPMRPGNVRRTHEQRHSTEDSGLRNSSDSPAHHDGGGVRSSSESNRRTGRSEHSIERSPLHRQARAPGRDSPSWEGKSSYDGSHGTPGRSRMRPVGRDDETNDTGAAVPKFGAWNESDPQSAEGYTHIFNKVREERQMGPGKAPGTPTSSSANFKKQNLDDNAKSCCFCWGRN